MHRLYSLCVVIAIFAGAGCGGAKKPVEALVPVSGKVTLDGETISGIAVIFTPAKGNVKSHGGIAVTDDDGEFQMKNYMKMDGIPAGEYIVTFSLTESANGESYNKNSPPVPGVTFKEKIPPKWSDLTKSNLHNQITIPGSGKSGLNYKITRK